MNSTLKGNSKLEELIFHLSDEDFIKESYGKRFFKFQGKLEEFFHYFFEIIEEFNWEIREFYQERKSGIEVYITEYFTFISSKKIEFISLEEVKVDGDIVIRLKLCIKDHCGNILFSISHTYDCCDDYQREGYLKPRECSREIYNFKDTLPTIMDKLELSQGQ